LQKNKKSTKEVNRELYSTYLQKIEDNERDIP